MNLLLLILLIVVVGGFILRSLPYLIYGIPFVIVCWLLLKLFSFPVALFIGIVLVLIVFLKN